MPPGLFVLSPGVARGQRKKEVVYNALPRGRRKNGWEDAALTPGEAAGQGAGSSMKVLREIPATLPAVPCRYGSARNTGTFSGPHGPGEGEDESQTAGGSVAGVGPEARDAELPALSHGRQTYRGLDMDVEDVDQDWLRVAILNRNNQRTRVLWDDSVWLNSTEDKRPRNVQGRAYCFR